MSFVWLTRFPPYPPLPGGDIEYSRELLHSLGRQAPVHAIAYEAPGVAIPADSPVRWDVLPYRRPSPIRGVLSPLPDVAFRFRSADYLAHALAAAKNSEGVLVDFIGMAWIVGPLRRALAASGAKVPVVMITHNHEGRMRRRAAGGMPFPRSAVIGYDAMKAARLERAANHAADGLTAIIEEDAAAFAQECSTPAAVLLPGYRGPRRAERRIDAATPRRAAIIGNRAGVQKVAVLGRVLEAFAAAGVDSQVQIEIGGAGDLAAMARRYDKFAFKGFIDDLPAYLETVRLGLIPDDLGGGFKLRVLSLAFQRVPILGLKSAMTGTTFVPGVHYHAVDDLEEMARVMPTLIDDIDRLNALQEAAYDHCRTQFDWDDRGRRLQQFLTGLAERPI